MSATKYEYRWIKFRGRWLVAELVTELYGDDEAYYYNIPGEFWDNYNTELIEEYGEFVEGKN